MKIRTVAAPDKERPLLILSADVGSKTLHLFSRFDSGARVHSLEDVVANRTAPVEGALTEVAALAKEHGFHGVRVLCEASGGYERLLLSVAQRLGFQTALVSSEQVGQLTKVVSLDTGKTDKKDARGIHLAGELRKDRPFRVLPQRYVILRRLTAFHDDETLIASTLRMRLHAVIVEIFPDYNQRPGFAFSKTGRVLLRQRLLCPHRLVRLGEARLLSTLRRHMRYVRTSTVTQLIESATTSIRSAPPRAVTDILSERLAVLMAEFEMHEAHAEALKAQIEDLGAQLKASGELPPIDEVVSGLTLFNLARLIGQTGPLSNFPSQRQILRYGGMNLQERESGTYKGKTRLSKKGRPLLRKVLSQATYPLLRRDRLLGTLHAKRCTHMKKKQAMVASMRKLLTMVWGAHRSASAFNPARVHRCASQFARAA